jgi:hypothetical protein
MRNIFLIVALAVLSASSASAQQARDRKQPDKPAASLPLRTKGANPCMEYGAGFVRVDGSSTCIKVGGTMSVGAGGTR